MSTPSDPEYHPSGRESGESDIDDDKMDDEEEDPFDEIRSHQPSITSFFPGMVDYNCAPDFQGKEFNIDGPACAFNMKHGLILEFNDIMGFFAEMAVRGYHIQMNELSPLSILDMSKTANMIIDVHNGCGKPHEDDRMRSVLPNIILSIVIVKTEVNPDNCSFFSAFYLAFCNILQDASLQSAEDQERYCKRVIANLGKAYPMLRHVISPVKSKRRPSV